MNVLIAGGGIGGLTAALCLAQVGHRVSVLEQASEFGEIGAGIQLSPNCTRVLHHLGLAADLEACAFLPEGTQFRHWRSGKVISQRPLGQVAVQRYGAPYYHIHRGDLLRVLVTAARQQAGISLHLNERVESVQQDVDGVAVNTQQGHYQADLLVGADGIHSVVRGYLWGEAKPTFTGNVAWRALVPTNALPEGLVRPMSTAWWGPHKHFVHYYVRQGEYVNCVCVVEKAGWEVESWTEPGDYDELKSDFAGWHSDIQTLIESADRSSLFKWALFDRPPMSAWGQGRITLLGDACHPTLPFMAQGAAMAIEDGAVLAGCLPSPQTSVVDLEVALQRYETLRKPRTAGIQNGSRRNARIFHMTGIQAWLRNRAASRAGGSTMDKLFAYNALTATEQ